MDIRCRHHRLWPANYTNYDAGNLLIFENDQLGDLPLTFTYSSSNDPVISNPGTVAGAPFPSLLQPSSTAAAAPAGTLFIQASAIPMGMSG